MAHIIREISIKDTEALTTLLTKYMMNLIIHFIILENLT